MELLDSAGVNLPAKDNANDNTALLPGYVIDWGIAPAVGSISWLAEGDYCRCYLVGDTHVFRFAKHAQASAAMRRERCLLPILRDALPVEVPEIAFAGWATDTGQAMIGYRLLSGEPLTQGMLEDLPLQSREDLLAQLAEAVRRLHTLPLPPARLCHLERLHPLHHLTGVMHRARREVKPLLKARSWGHYQCLFDQYVREPALHAYQPALLHGDLSPDHILADATAVRLTGIIDFGDACLGDSAWDLIYVYEDYGPGALKAFLEQYDPTRAQLLERKVRLYAHLNNVGYCAEKLAAGHEVGILEAVAILEEQALEG
jgi:aminoglycoside 2''-phosphotransferase